MITMTGDSVRKLQDEISHIKGGMEKAIARASKRVASGAKTKVSKELRQVVAIKAGDINKTLKTTNHKRGAVFAILETDRIPLKYFGARQTAKGVSYKLDKAKGRSFIAGAFGPNIPRLGNHVFKRQGKARKPIVKLFGVSTWAVFIEKKMYKPTEGDIQKKFEDRLKHEIGYLIAKAKAKRNG
jgi:hypothetical protein